jgi:hypothetical protein
MSPPVTPNTTSGFILIPFVSSSKNLRRPALEAGKGAFFFLLIMNVNLIIIRTLNMFRPIKYEVVHLYVLYWS